MRFLGPVVRYDLVRVARRQRLALWRAVYGLALLAALFLLYTSVLPHAWLGGTRVKPADAAAFANRFFAVFTVLQFAAVIILTPALTASALAEERGHNTLVFLLTTQLTSREIILSKLFTRFLQVGLLVLTGLPVLGVLQFMGGVEPTLVLATYVALVLTALSLGGLGLACAVFVKKPQNAAWRAYQIVLAYVGLSLLSIWYWELPVISRFVAGMGRWPVFRPLGSAMPTPPPLTTAETVLEGFNAANPYFAYLRLKYEQDAGAFLTDALPKVLRDYALGHGVFALLFVGLAVWRLRTVAAKQGTGLTHKKAIMLRAAPHPPIKDRPVFWKEIYCEAKPRQRWLALFFSRWFFVASFLPAWIILLKLLDDNFGRMPDYTLTMLRYGGTLVIVGLCLRVALHAARSIGQERDRLTLDNLLTTDLTPDEIVKDKWHGSYISGRWVLLWLVIHWCLGIIALALHPLALPLLLMECLAYGAFFVSLGMYCAARFPTTKQAVSAALVIGLLGTSLLPWAGGKVLWGMLPEEVIPPQHQLYSYGNRYEPTRPWPEKMAIGLTPAWVLSESVIPNISYLPPNYYWNHGHENQIEVLWPWIILGLVVYTLAAMVLARRAAVLFRLSVRGAHPPHPFYPSSRDMPPALAGSSQ